MTRDIPIGPARNRLLYIWHPEAWEEVDGQWLPRIKWWRLRPGVNGVKDRGKMGHIQAEGVMSAGRGFVVLDPVNCPMISRDETGALVESTGYVDTYPAKSGRYIVIAYGSLRGVMMSVLIPK